VLGGDVADQLGDDDRLADAGTAEDAGLAALGEGRDQVDDLDPGLEDFDLRRLVFERGRGAVDRVGGLDLDRSRLVDRLADDVEDAAERLQSDWDGDRRPDVDDLHSTLQPIGRAHRDRAHPVVAEVLLDFESQGVAVLEGDLDAVVDLGQLFRRELDVDHRAGDLDDRPRGDAGAGGGGWGFSDHW
jgi:hypothetical protein